MTSSPSCRSHWAHSGCHKGRWQSELPMAPCWMNPPCQGETPPAGLRKTHPKACHHHPWQTSTGLSSNSQEGHSHVPQNAHCQLHGSGREEVSPPAQRTWETGSFVLANKPAGSFLALPSAGSERKWKFSERSSMDRLQGADELSSPLMPKRQTQSQLATSGCRPSLGLPYQGCG